MSPGEKQRRLRKRERERLAHEQAIAALRSAGARCGNCKHFRMELMVYSHICDLGSDFYGYQFAQADGLCVGHEVPAHD